jgi:hypothetical protein
MSVHSVFEIDFEVLDLDVHVRGYRLQDDLYSWILLPDCSLKVLRIGLVLLFVMLRGGIVRITVRAKVYKNVG